VEVDQDDWDAMMIRTARLEEKLDRLIAYAEEADTAVKGFLAGKNAKYLAMVAKVAGR
jgi:hypothetical protein